jgi:hypothetical protein
VFGDVDWTHRGQYMQRRHGVPPAVANEALGDPDAQVFDPDPKSISGESVRVIGFAPTTRTVLTVIVVGKRDDAGWWGVNGWPANAAERRIYRERSRRDE